MQQAQTDILTLQSQLIDAKHERSQRMEYDALASAINALNTRKKSSDNVFSLNSKIAHLESQCASHESLLTLRRKALHSLLAQLAELRAVLADEAETSVTVDVDMDECTDEGAKTAGGEDAARSSSTSPLRSNLPLAKTAEGAQSTLTEPTHEEEGEEGEVC